MFSCAFSIMVRPRNACSNKSRSRSMFLNIEHRGRPMTHCTPMNQYIMLQNHSSENNSQNHCDGNGSSHVQYYFQHKRTNLGKQCQCSRFTNYSSFVVVTIPLLSLNHVCSNRHDHYWAPIRACSNFFNASQSIYFRQQLHISAATVIVTH